MAMNLINSARSAWSNLFTSGFDDPRQSPFMRRVIFTNIFAVVAASGLFMFFLVNLLEARRTLLTMVELAIALFAVFIVVYLRVTHNIIRAQTLVMIAALLLMSLLFFSGGMEKTGIYWYYILPSAAFFLKGRRRAWAWLAIAGVEVAIMIALGAAHWASVSYTFIELRQFAASFIVVSLIVSNYERIRDDYEMDIAVKTNELVVEIRERQQAEKEKEQIISLQRATLESTADGILAVDPEGKISDFNQRFARMWCLPDSILALHDDAQILDFVMEQLLDPQGFLAKVNELYSAPDRESFDLLQFKDGRCFERYSRPQLISGRPLGRVWSFRDITARKQTEAERQALLDVMQGMVAAGNLHDFLKNVHMSISNVICAENFFVTIYNKDTALFEEAYSVDKFDLPAQPSRLENSISSYVFRSGQPLLLDQERFDELAARGEVELVGTNSPSWLGVPLKTSRETIGVMVVQDYDRDDRYSERELAFFASIAGQVALVVEQKRAVQALLASEERYRALVENASDLVYWADQSGQFTFMNRAALIVTGYEEKELMGKQYVTLVRPDMRAKALRLYGRQFVKKIRNTYSELPIITKDGREVWIGQNIQMVMKDGRVTGFQAVSRDITERKRAEDETKRQLAEKEILLREVHHRIKNNIASIGGLISLRLQAISSPAAVSVLQDAVSRINSMRVLYDKLLLSEDSMSISVENYIASLIDLVVAVFPTNTKITLDRYIADFHLDPKRMFPLGIIINELLTNIMKYAFSNRESGLIKVSLARMDNHVTLTIQDDGIGLPEGFDIKESKGFGLMLVKMLSQQLAGSFSIENHTGTRCTIEFNT